MRIEHHWCQVQAGIDRNLLSDTEIPIDYIETCWIMGIRDFLRTYKLKIDLTDDSIPHTNQRVGDELIMDAIQTRGECSPTELQKLNAGRLFLQVARVSDIASVDGKRIRPGMLTGSNDGNHRSAIKWPRQGPTQPMWWKLWKTKVTKTFSIDGKSPVLRRPLGAWNTKLRREEWTTLANTSSG